MNDSTSRLMMSDSLQGMVPQLEDEALEKYSDSFVVGVLELDPQQFIDSPLVGSLVGLAVEEITKFDVKTSISAAYAILKMATMNAKIICNAFQFHLGPDVTRVVGPFFLQSPRMIDLDHDRKTCTLAVDLVKIVDL